jgi:DnaK suppressor protein
MTDAERDKLHRTLLKLQSELRQLLEDSSDGAQPISLNQPIGRLSRMDAMQQQSMVQANRRTAQLQLDSIEAALKRFPIGEYGLCAACEEEIALARLRARPDTPFCMECQQKREKSGS